MDELEAIMNKMTVKLRNLKVMTDGKVEILSNGWDKMLQSLGQNMRDKYTKAFIDKLCMVCANPELKMAVLNKYI